MNAGSRYPRGLAIELTEGCNRRCGFCPLSYLPFPRDHRSYMTVPWAKKITQNLLALRNQEVPAPKVFFAMSGEPLLNPNFCEIVELFRGVLPDSNFVLITNGDLLPKQDIKRIFRSIDVVLLDAYDKACAERAEALGNKEGIYVANFYRDWAPHGLSPFADLKRKHQNTIVVMDDIAVHTGKVSSRKLHNYGGNAPLTMVPLKMRKICANPIRELVIKHDGKVTICCMDVGNEFVAGDLTKEPADKVWFHPAMNAARKLLRRGQRGFSPCMYCTASLPSSFTITNTATMEWPGSADYSAIRNHFKSLNALKTKNGRKRLVC